MGSIGVNTILVRMPQQDTPAMLYPLDVTADLPDPLPDRDAEITWTAEVHPSNGRPGAVCTFAAPWTAPTNVIELAAVDALLAELDLPELIRAAAEDTRRQIAPPASAPAS